MNKTIIHQLESARDEAQSHVDKIDKAITILRKPPRAECHITASGRAAISKAQRERWAKVRRLQRRA